jgi:long-chain acyl-CoA synthetase
LSTTDPVLLQDILHRSAERLPDKVALVCDARRLTYAEVDAAASRLANALIHRGIRRGDRVVIFLHNSVEAVVSIFGVLNAGATFVAINQSTKADKLAYILNDCGATALVTHGDRLSLVDQAMKAVPSLQVAILTGRRAEGGANEQSRVFYFDDIQQEFPADRPRRLNIDLDLACLVYTSGSTGDPKGVMTDHGTALFACRSIMSYLESAEDDIVLSVLPLSFDYGLYQLLMTVAAGGRLVLERSFAYAGDLLMRIQEERVTGLPGVPTVFGVLLHTPLDGFDVSSLRYLTNTAAAMPPSHVSELRRRFAGVKLFCMYGLTETKRTLYLPPDQVDARPGSVGIAIPGTEVWLEDCDGRRVGPGETGELVVRGRHVMRGYWNAPTATAARFRPGPTPGERVCYTGDLFTMDADGYFFFVARRDDVIKSRGQKVAPTEVEAVLYGLPGVGEAVVIGVHDPIHGEAVKAVIVRRDVPLTERMVLAHCRAHLEDYMVPKHVEFRTDLPKTSSGKISRRALVEEVHRA